MKASLSESSAPLNARAPNHRLETDPTRFASLKPETYET